MKYIWINPVTANMYDSAALQEFLEANGFMQVEASSHWLEMVRNKYEKTIENAEKTIIDVRCPKVPALVHAYDLQDIITIPEIEPILIHCGREISERAELQGTEKIITTPCRALADLGNSLQLKETRFIPWKQFLVSLDGCLSAEPLAESPIPPGYFDELHCKKISVTGKDAICDLFENFIPHQYDIIEMLYCKDGCHNGDGICGCK